VGGGQSEFDLSIILNWLKKRTDYMIIGQLAVDLLTDKQLPKFIKVQVICSDVELLKGEITNIISQHMKLTPQFKLHQAGVATEPRMCKTVVSIMFNDRTLHIMDVYNSGSYELVPYTVYRDYHIGFPYVLKMYLLMDIWFLRIIFVLKLIDKFMLNKSVTNAMAYFNQVDSLMSPPHIQKFLPHETYLGVYVDLVKYKQKQGLNNEMFPYYPEQYRYNKGQYRSIKKTHNSYT
jgi:hypothetical protein